jgi:hypothetical protein
VPINETDPRYCRLELDDISRFRMFFFNDRRGHLVELYPTIGVYGEDQDAAIAMAQRMWDGLAGEESALGFSLLDCPAKRVCYVEVRRSTPMKAVTDDLKS